MAHKECRDKVMTPTNGVALTPTTDAAADEHRMRVRFIGTLQSLLPDKDAIGHLLSIEHNEELAALHAVACQGLFFKVATEIEQEIIRRHDEAPSVP